MGEEKPAQVIEEHLLTDSSTNIKKSVYNHWEKTLTLVFQNDQIYKYLEVDEETFEQYKAHDSKGKAHMTLIKGKYEFEKIN
jgi:phage-related protein